MVVQKGNFQVGIVSEWEGCDCPRGLFSGWGNCPVGNLPGGGRWVIVQGVIVLEPKIHFFF